MLRRIALWSIWSGFLIYILGFAPPIQPDTLQPVQTLLSGQIPAINPVMLALFSLIGIWLLIYACLMLADGRLQRLPAWAFLVAAIGTGIVGLIPYLALRDPNPRFFGRKDAAIRLFDSRQTGVILLISGVVLVGFALLGDWQAFMQEWLTNRFVHGMGLAFWVFWLVFPSLLGDDMARRGWQDDRVFWATAGIPLFGALVYLCLRPPLPSGQSREFVDRPLSQVRT